MQYVINKCFLFDVADCDSENSVMWCGLWVPQAQYTLNKLYVNGEDFHQEWYWYMEINKQAFSILFVKVSSLRF